MLVALHTKRTASCGCVQAWELLDPPSGWDTSGPVLATGYYHISNTALQMVMLIDDAMATACHQGEHTVNLLVHTPVTEPVIASLWHDVATNAVTPANGGLHGATGDSFFAYFEDSVLLYNVAGDMSMAQAVIGAVSKMAVMYVTMLEAPSPNDAPFLVLLRHNDLQYVANHLLVAPFLFDPELKQLLGSGLWFGNEALQLRTAARAAYTDLVSATPEGCTSHTLGKCMTLTTC